jgi:hypothetical protein
MVHIQSFSLLYFHSLYSVKQVPTVETSAGIFKLLRSPGMDSKPAYVAWQAGTTTLSDSVPAAPKDCSKIPAPEPTTCKRLRSPGTDSKE